MMQGLQQLYSMLKYIKNSKNQGKRPKKSYLQSQTHSILKIVSLNKKRFKDRSFSQNRSNAKSQLKYPPQWQNAKSFKSNRANTQNTNYQDSMRLVTVPDLMKEDELELLQYFSLNVFSPGHKYNRFTNILKSKCHQNRTKDKPYYTQAINIKQVSIKKISLTNLNIFKRKKGLAQQKNATSKRKIVQRTSSAVKRDGILVKRRRNSYNQHINESCVAARHIETLKTLQDQGFMNRDQLIAIKSNCVLKNQIKNVNTRDLEIKGCHLESIDPWQVDYQKVKQLVDMDISIRI